MNSQFGMKPTASTATPTPSQPARQPPRRIMASAISGSATSPAICAMVAIETAMGRRATNQLFTAP